MSHDVLSERATNYLPDALAGIAACIEAALDRKRRRERDEMDALNAEANPLD